MASSGVCRQDLARAFDLTPSAISNVLKGFEDEAKAVESRLRFRVLLKNADDLDRKWVVADLMDALGVGGVTRTGLERHFDGLERSETSLREIMDLTISHKATSRPGHLITPLLGVRCLGIASFWSVVYALTDIDMGARCNGEWGTRLSLLRRSTRIRGDRLHSWSKPIDKEIPSRPPSDSLPVAR